MLETRQEYVAMEGNWSVAMAGLKTTKGSVRVGTLRYQMKIRFINIFLKER